MPTIFLQFRKTKIKLQENENWKLNIKFQPTRKMKMKIWYQFSIFYFNRKWKLIFRWQFSCYNFSIRARNIYFWFVFLISGKSEKAWDKWRKTKRQRKPIKVNIKELFVYFCCERIHQRRPHSPFHSLCYGGGKCRELELEKDLH